MDIVYILGSGSKWNNNELRYSLRSLEKHFPHRNVFIVGEFPNWLRNVNHMDVNDAFPYSDGGKLRNAVRKIRAACEDERISDQFVLMNDDFFFLEDCTEIKPFSLGSMQQTIDRHITQKGYYYEALVRTKRYLEEKGIKDPTCYAIHCPIVYDKKKFLQMTDGLDLMKAGYAIRTIYGNTFNIGKIERKDVKISSESALMDFLQKEDKGDFLSSGDNTVLYTDFQKWLDNRFPEQSKYEQPRTDRFALQRRKTALPDDLQAKTE